MHILCSIADWVAVVVDYGLYVVPGEVCSAATAEGQSTDKLKGEIHTVQFTNNT